MNKAAPLLMVSWAITFIVCLWGGSLFISLNCSQPPTPSETEFAAPSKDEGGNNQPDADPLQRGTKTAPFVVRLERTRADEKAAKDNQRQAEENAALQRKQTLFNGLLVLITAIQVGIVVRQLRTHRAELRAYVSIGPNLNRDHDPVPQTPYHLVFNCRNRGKTPARDIGFVGAIKRVEIPIKPSEVPVFGDKLDEKRINLFPGECLSHRNLGFSANTETTFTQAEIGTVYDGTHAFVIAIKIWYLDAFNKAHETQEYWAIVYRGGRRTIFMLPGKSVIT